MRSNRSPKLLLVALTAVLAACGEAPVSPTAPAVENGPRFGISIDNMASDLSSADFTVTSTGGVFRMGPHAIYIPSQSICDPAFASYGVGEWDKPCQVTTAPVRIHAQLRTVGGYEFVEFSPSLRFAPSKWVMIYMHAGALQFDPTRKLNILWSPFDGARAIDESLTDPSLQTRTLPTIGILYRRIKHFSVYQVSAGLATDIFADTVSVGVEVQ